ncbi:DNA-3-methyladenine glycosylase [Haloglycomyces albus]|uniref:DNA-3-methyladenine glycosylase n=1 Tax=Haloglycomyces albus TaxID=526067 RepID=UPI00046D3AA4|nr:DNA-3-methyladenine glycosylase [Haloglycomyces albus]
MHRVEVRRDFFARDAVEVAPELLGCVVVANDVTLRIVEVEAYRWNDPASHAHRGPTRANSTMFGPPGHLYVYFTYGMHHCGNLVTNDVNEGAGVLLRAAEVLHGSSHAHTRRGKSTERDLARGPARLAKTMGWTKRDDGTDMIGRVFHDLDATRPDISSGPRVGVRHAADVPRRFWITGSSFVSSYRRNPRAR